VSPARGLLHELHTDRHQDHVNDDGIATQILADLGLPPGAGTADRTHPTTTAALARLA
jgi:hypothetical protein